MRKAPRALWAYALINVAQRIAEPVLLGHWLDAPFVLVVAIYSCLVLCGWRVLWQIAIVFEVSGLFLYFGRHVPVCVAVLEAMALIYLSAPSSRAYFRPGYYWTVIVLAGRKEIRAERFAQFSVSQAWTRTYSPEDLSPRR